MKKMKKLLPTLSGILIVLTIGLTWTSCEKEKDSNPEVYFWAKSHDYNKLYLYGDSILLKEYDVYGTTKDGGRSYTSFYGRHLIKFVYNKNKSKILVYKNNKLVSTCQYDKNSIYKNSSLHYNAIASFSGKDVYVLGCAEHYKTPDTCYEMVLWKNSKIIWKQPYTIVHRQDWHGFGVDGTDVYWLVKKQVAGDDEYFLYKNGEEIKTYKTADYLYLMVNDGDIYIFGRIYHGGKVWRNDELIFENNECMIIENIQTFDGDLYLSLSTGFGKGRLLKNGEILYDQIEGNLSGVYKYQSDLYYFAYGKIWKNGERFFFFPTGVGRRIYHIFKK